MALLRAVWRGVQLFERFGPVFVTANLLAALASLFVLPAFAAYAGLVRLASDTHNAPTISIEEFWAGFRAGFLRGLVLLALTALLVMVVLFNWRNFSLENQLLLAMLRSLWVFLLAAWFCILLYVFPLLEQMERPNVLLGLRNAGLMLLKNPLFSLGLFVISLLFIIISVVTVIPVALILPGMLACITDSAVRDRLAKG
jgi:uncharacterized membrane protein YesL